MTRALWFGYLVCALVFACSDGGDGADDTDAGADAGGDTDTDADSDADACEFDIDPQRIFDDVEWMADDERGGRLPGTPGNTATEEYMRDLFVEIGLEPAGDGDTYFQAFSYDQWQLNECPTVAFDGSDLTQGEDFDVFFYSGAGSVEAEVVFAGYGTTVPPFDASEYPNCPFDPDTGYDDFGEVDVTGKIALVLRNYPGGDDSIATNCPANDACNSTPCIGYFGYKAANAALHGAAGMILTQHYANPGSLLEGGTMNPEYYDEDFPAVYMTRDLVEAAVPDLADWADTIDTDMVPASAETAVTASLNVDAGDTTITVNNILGMIPGSDPDIGHEVVLVGAHMDHMGTELCSGEVFNGADDNASGTAAVMELARALAGCGVPPKRTVVFVGWNAEEQGLIGSRYYVQNPIHPLADFNSVLNLDMVGAGDGSGLYLYNGVDPNSAWLVDVMEAAAEEQGLDYAIQPMVGQDNSDHAYFAAAGIPAVFSFTLGPHPTYHTINDVIDGILLEDLEAATLLNWALLVPLAMGTEDEYLEMKSAPAPTPASTPAFTPAPAALDGPR